ncbi:ParB N-terminal domain-containing protein [Aestuariispira ectoiniformans]|uniref:ParB N-terminal domain-containing protein n=1 Tax=Aestuariispira ectoiniformans TaxID=2775080 RepID=UPI00223BED44|nr:ParB N-terminal domain-containing protein [Aestuariispira ectoiniformans]
MISQTSGTPVVLVETSRILRHEEHIPERLEEIRETISCAGVWTTPLLVEWDDLVLMDGHHRLAFAREQGLSHVPCLLADYRSVAVESRRAQFTVTPTDVRTRARTGRLYPPKTTRHLIPSSWRLECAFGLDELGHEHGARNVVELAATGGEAR